jgi:hypothetical protein
MPVQSLTFENPPVTPRGPRNKSPQELAIQQEADGFIAAAIQALDEQEVTDYIKLVCEDEQEVNVYAARLHQAGLRVGRVTQMRRKVAGQENCLWFKVKPAGTERISRPRKQNADSSAELDSSAEPVDDETVAKSRQRRK